MNLSWEFKHFTELTTVEFHDLIALRLKAFVVEQNATYVDLDGKDKKSYHMICRDGFGNIVATARIIPAGIAYPEVSMGRLVVSEDIRKNQFGVELMNRCLQFIKEEFGDVAVRVSVQKHLERFVGKFKFTSTENEYMEANLPHVEMLYMPQNN